MKTTLREIRNTIAIDVTRWSCEDLYKLTADEKGFKSIGYSIGVYGINGLLLQGNTTHNFYKVTARTNAIFVLH